MLVINKFLEFWYRCVVDVLTDAQVYSEHASKSAIDIDDVNLAIQSQANFNLSQLPCLEVLLELAQNCNKIPLPKSIAGLGFPLPPDQDTLISPNYKFAIPNKRSVEPRMKKPFPTSTHLKKRRQSYLNAKRIDLFSSNLIRH